MLHDTLAGAAGLEQAIVASAPVAPVAIRTEVVSCAVAIERDRLGAALRQLAEDVRDPTMDLVVAALLLAAEHQAAHLGDLLGRPRSLPADRRRCAFGSKRVGHARGPR